MSLKSKLDAIFSDDMADDLFGKIEIKQKNSKGSNPIEGNFSKVIGFYLEHGRVPLIGASDSREEELAFILAGIQKSSSLTERVKHLDTPGLLNGQCPDGANGEAHDDISAQADEEPKISLLFNASLTSLNKQSDEIINTLNILELLESQETPDKNQVDEIAGRLHEISEVISAVGNDLSKLSESLPVAAPAPLTEFRDEEETVAPQPEYSLGDSENSSIESIEDVFNDDDFGDIFDESDIATDLLGGERAIKSHQRALLDQGNRSPCSDFDEYRSRFESYQQMIEKGTLVVSNDTGGKIKEGDLFLWDGLIALFTGDYIKDDVSKSSGNRLHIVFSNGTEAWLREGSISRSMYAYHDRGGKILCRRLVVVSEDLLIDERDNLASPGDNATGYIYVARTLSGDPGLATAKSQMLKIGVTKNPVKSRISNAENDPTFLMAPVELVSTYTLYNLEPRKVEEILHAFFGDARLKISSKDRFGKSVTSNEWFMVPAKAVSEAVKLLVAGDLSKFRFDNRDSKIKSLKS